MSPYQLIVVALCTLISALDGFDVLVVAFTAPVLSKEWGLGPADIGLLFSAGLIGMGLGALFVAPMGDWIGRRTAVIVCLAIMAVGMIASGYAYSHSELLMLRVFTGLGMGGILANLNILVGEYSNDRQRDLCTSIMAVGYQVGAAFGGLVAIWIMRHHDWRAVYLAGGGAAVAFILASLWLLPESIDFLDRRRPGNALRKINQILQRMGRQTLAVLPDVRGAARAVAKPRLSSLLADGRAVPTVAACLTYLLVMSSVYFFISWIPKIITQSGLSTENGISASVLMNSAGVVSGVIFGLLARRIGVRRLSAVAMVCLAAAGVWFGRSEATVSSMLTAATFVGFFIGSSVSALYAVVPKVFALPVRTTGTGLAMSFGRLGGAVGPYIAGLAMAHGFDRPEYCLLLAVPVFLGAFVLRWMNPIPEDASAQKPAAASGGSPVSAIKSA